MSAMSKAARNRKRKESKRNARTHDAAVGTAEASAPEQTEPATAETAEAAEAGVAEGTLDESTVAAEAAADSPPAEAPAGSDKRKGADKRKGSDKRKSADKPKKGAKKDRRRKPDRDTDRPDTEALDTEAPDAEAPNSTPDDAIANAEEQPAPGDEIDAAPTPGSDDADSDPDRAPRLPDDDSDVPAEISTESVVEAILFATDSPLSAKKIAQILGVGTAGDVKKHIGRLNTSYAKTGRSFRIEEIAKGFQMLTTPAYNNWLKQVLRIREETKLSRAAMETLAIIAYKQPILRADIEAIRGVAAGEMINRLREMELVKIVGRAEEIGRPILYGTTKKFLEVFGLASLEDLPKSDEFAPPASQAEREAIGDPPAEDHPNQGFSDAGTLAEEPSAEYPPNDDPPAEARDEHEGDDPQDDEGRPD